MKSKTLWMLIIAFLIFVWLVRKGKQATQTQTPVQVSSSAVTVFPKSNLSKEYDSEGNYIGYWYNGILEPDTPIGFDDVIFS